MDLKPYNTFGVSVQAPNFNIIRAQSEIKIINEFPSQPVLFLGEGANILFTKDFPGLILKNELQGRKIISENSERVVLEVASGENWLKLVKWSVEGNLSGIENLALIPGTVGAAAVGNIAAYGQNFGDVVDFVEGVHTGDLTHVKRLSNSECDFTYRHSAIKDDFFVTSVGIKLSKKAQFDTKYYSRYESLKSELPDPPYTPKMIAEAVTRLRTKKLPNWHILGTAGSFFKNPFVTNEKFARLQKEIPDLQAYPVDKMLYPKLDDPVFKMVDEVKIPAGRLLDELGWKGKRIGNVGTFEKHALIIVNYGEATGLEILDFSRKMQEDVKKNFEIDLEPEVKIL